MLAGAAFAILATAAYLGVQAAQFRRCLGLGKGRAIGLSIRVYLEAVVLVFVVAALLIGASSP